MMPLPRIASVIAFVFLFFSSCVTTDLNQSHRSQSLASRIVEDHGPSIVTITTYTRDKNFNTFGTGFFISSDGVIATNYHLLKNAHYAEVKTFSGTVHSNVEIIDYSEDRDVAILQIDRRYTPAVTLGNPSEVKQGDKIATIGNPSGYQNTVSDGIISAIRDLDIIKIFQITCPISKGSSGGPLFNNKGEVIGITALIEESGQNLNFAISIEALQKLSNSKKTISFAENNNRNIKEQTNRYIERQKKSNELDPKDSLYEEAYELYKKAESEDPILFTTLGTNKNESIKLLEKAIEINPNYHAAILVLAHSLDKEKTLKKSEELYLKSIELKPLYQNGYSSLALFYLNLKDYNNAIKYYTKSIEIGPENAYLHNSLAKAYYYTGKRKEAKEHFKKALQINDYLYNDTALYGLAILSLEQNDLVSAWKLVLDTSSKYPEPFSKRVITLSKKYSGQNNFFVNSIFGHINFVNKDYNDAINNLLKAKKLNPKKFSQHFQLGSSFYWVSKYKSAVENLLIAKNVSKYKHTCYLYLGYIYGRSFQDFVESEEKVTHDYSKAINYYQLAKKSDPKDYYSSYGLSYCYYLNKQYFTALREVENALDLDKKETGYDLQGDIYYEIDEYEKAIESYKIYLSKKDDYYARFKIAISLYKLNKIEEAIKYLEDYLEDTNYEKNDYQKNFIKSKLAHLYFENSNYLKSKSLLLEYLKYNPKNNEEKFRLGLCLLRLDEHNEAINWFKESIKNRKEDYPTCHNIGLSYLHLKEYKKSLSWLRKAYKIERDEDTKELIDTCQYKIEMAHYPERLEQASKNNDDIGALAKILLLIEDYTKANNLWISGRQETEYKNGENIVSPKIFEAKAVFEMTEKDLKKISSKNPDIENVITDVESAIIQRISGTELHSKGYYLMKKDYKGEFEKGMAKINIADTYLVKALKEIRELLTQINTNFSKAAVSIINENIKYYGRN